MNETQKLLSSITPAPATQEELRLILSLTDLTSLDGSDNEKTIAALCENAKKFRTAAVCIYPSFVRVAKTQLKVTNISVASVAGAFPSGQLPLPLRLEEAKYAISEGADEVDMVISRGKFLAGDLKFISEEISEFRRICGKKILKVILETGELASAENIRRASEMAIEAGADFIKTSTGKIAAGATPEAVCTMLLAIKDSGKKIGIKPSGGISDVNAAVTYLRLTEKILGKAWLNPQQFRFGASRLASVIYSQLQGENSAPNR